MGYFAQDQLKTLDPTKVPRHVAVIMDGNRRWARQKAVELLLGHQTGADILLDVLKAGKELGIQIMTLFVFSTENWNRRKVEVTGLLWLFETFIAKQILEMKAQNIRFETIGDLSKFSPSLLRVIEQAKETTKECTGMEVVFAMNYGARDEIKRAVKKIIASGLKEDEITDEKISSFLDTARYPDPELLIRTSGQSRLSNFLLWQLSYAELYITSILWPDFTPRHLLEAVLEYQVRERRIGL